MFFNTRPNWYGDRTILFAPKHYCFCFYFSNDSNKISNIGITNSLHEFFEHFDRLHFGPRHGTKGRTDRRIRRTFMGLPAADNEPVVGNGRGRARPDAGHDAHAAANAAAGRPADRANPVFAKNRKYRPFAAARNVRT